MQGHVCLAAMHSVNVLDSMALTGQVEPREPIKPQVLQDATSGAGAQDLHDTGSVHGKRERSHVEHVQLDLDGVEPGLHAGQAERRQNRQLEPRGRHRASCALSSRQHRLRRATACQLTEAVCGEALAERNSFSAASCETLGRGWGQARADESAHLAT